MRAVDRWVRAAFSGIFLALGFYRFDGESQPSHLPLTRAVRPKRNRRNAVPAVYIRKGGRRIELEERARFIHRWTRSCPIQSTGQTENSA